MDMNYNDTIFVSVSVCDAGFTCASGLCIDEDNVCDFNDDCDNDETVATCALHKVKDRCDFENGRCDFLEDDADDFDWTIRQGQDSQLVDKKKSFGQMVRWSHRLSSVFMKS